MSPAVCGLANSLNQVIDKKWQALGLQEVVSDIVFLKKGNCMPGWNQKCSLNVHIYKYGKMYVLFWLVWDLLVYIFVLFHSVLFSRRTDTLS